MIPARYNKKNLSRAVRNPSLAVDELRRQVEPYLHIPQKIRFKRKYGPGIEVMKQDWDFLIILDACRYDAFREVVDINGELRSVISRGSHSVEFCEKNFQNGTHHDTVYVTANGYGAQIAENVFHDLIFTDESDAVPEVDVLHSSSEGMAPSTVYNAAVNAYRNYPDKRIIVHFMQPHDPYLGSKAEELRSRLEHDGITVISRDARKLNQYDTDDENVVSTLAGAAKRGYITKAELKEIYYENLDIVTQYVDKLVKELAGEIIVTADHGELLGEHNTIGHPKCKYFRELREVPWLRITADTRPSIRDEEPKKTSKIEDEIIENDSKHSDIKLIRLFRPHYSPEITSSLYRS